MTEYSLSRRGYLGGAGAAATAGLAGCLGSGDGGDALTVAYMPIFPDLQYFVMEGEGYFGEIDAEIDGREFSDGPSIVRAYGGGDIDVAMFGIVPSMIVVDRGIPAKATAANIVEPMAIMADEELQTLWEEHGADAFDVWEQQKGRKFRFGTFPQGSVPDILLRYWLTDGLGLDPESAVDIREINGANAVWQAIAGGEIDGTSIMEPVPTFAKLNDSSVTTFRTASEVMPGQPAAVTLMSDEVRNGKVAEQFLRQHVRATEFISGNPEATVEHVQNGMGLSQEEAQMALESPLSNFVTDPREITDGTEIFAEFAHENGKTDVQLSTDEIFDFSVYESL